MDAAIRLLEDRVERAVARLTDLRRERDRLQGEVGEARNRIAILEQENRELSGRVSGDAGDVILDEITQVLKQAIEELREDD